MDLAIVVPVLVLTGVGVLRGSAWATKVGYAVVGWVALLGATVAGMAIVMQATDDPEATVANTVVFSVFAAIALWLAVAYYHPLFRIRTSGSVGDEGSHTAGDRSDPVSTPAVAEAEPPVSRSSTESVSS